MSARDSLGSRASSAPAKGNGAPGSARGRPKSAAASKKVTFEATSKPIPAPQGSAQAAAKFARQLQSFDARHCERLAPGSVWNRPATAGDRPRSPAEQVQFLASKAKAEVLGAPAQEENAEGLLEALHDATAAAFHSEDGPRASAETAHGEDEEHLLGRVPKHTRSIWDMYCTGAEEAEAHRATATDTLRLLAGGKEDAGDVLMREEFQRLRTGEDAIAYFAKHGDESDVKVLYCRHVNADPRVLRPYDLMVVDDKERGADFFMISAKGVVHVSPGQSSDHLTLGDWMRQAMMFTVLLSMSFFKNYAAGKCFANWRRGARCEVYRATRSRLARHLFLAKRDFVEAQVGMHEALGRMRGTRLLHLEAGGRAGIEMSSFLAHQKELLAGSALDAQADAVRCLVDGVLAAVAESTERVESEAYATERGLFPRRQRSLSLVYERQMREEQAHRLRLCRLNTKMLGNFIRLADVMVQSSLVNMVVVQATGLLERLRSTPKIFSSSVAFAEDGKTIVFSPGCEDFQKVYEEVLGRAITVVGEVAAFTTAPRYEATARVDATPRDAGQVVEKDAAFRKASQAIKERIKADFAKAHQFAETYFVPYRKISVYCREWGAEAFQTGDLTHTAITEQMGVVSGYERELEKLKSVHTCGFLLIEARTLRAALVPVVEGSLAVMKDRLHNLGKSSFKHVIEKFDFVYKELQARPMRLDGFVDYVRLLRNTEEEASVLETMRTSVEEIYSTLRHYNIRIEYSEEIARDTLAQRAHVLENTALPEATIFVSEHLEGNAEEIVRRFEALDVEAATLEHDLDCGEVHALPPDSPSNAGAAAGFWGAAWVGAAAAPAGEVGSPASEASPGWRGAPGSPGGGGGGGPAQALATLEGIWERLEELEASAAWLNDSLALLEKQPRGTAALASAREACQLRLRLWELALQWQQVTSEWLSTTVAALSLGALRAPLEAFRRHAAEVAAVLPGDAIAEELRARVAAWLGRVPALALLTGPGMQQRHWAQVLSQAGVRPESGEATLAALQDAGFFEHGCQRELVEVAARAGAEFGLRSTVEGLCHIWDLCELPLSARRHADHITLGDQTETFDALASDATTLRVVLSDREALPEDVAVLARELLEKLDQAAEALGLWLEAQDAVLFLEPIISRGGRGLLGDAAVEAYLQAEKAWRLIMQRARLTYHTVLAATNQPSLWPTLRRILADTEHVRKELLQVLADRRAACPRLFLVPDGDLLAAVAAASAPPAPKARAPSKGEPRACEDPGVVGAALAALAPLLFPGVAGADCAAGAPWSLRLAAPCGDALALPVGAGSGDGAPTALRAIEDLISAAEGEMRDCLRLATNAAIAAVFDRGATQVLEEWASPDFPDVDWPAQAVAVALAVRTTFVCEATMHGKRAPKLDKVSDLVEALQDCSGDAGRSLAMQAFLLHLFHAEELLERLATEMPRGPSVDCFEWQCKVRTYWSGEGAQLRILDWEAEYGFEFLGVGPRMVRTPETERNYFGLASLMRARSSATVAVVGPGGCGKLAALRDLACAAGAPLVPLGGSAAGGVAALAALATLGAWGWLGAGSLPPPEAAAERAAAPPGGAPGMGELATTAQVLGAMLEARRAESPTLQIGAQEVRLAPRLGAVFLTAPSWGCATARLPGELLRQTRPLALAPPPVAKVAEHLLLAEGVEPELAASLAARLAFSIQELVAQSAATGDAGGLRRVRAAAAAAGAAARGGLSPVDVAAEALRVVAGAAATHDGLFATPASHGEAEGPLAVGARGAADVEEVEEEGCWAEALVMEIDRRSLGADIAAASSSVPMASTASEVDGGVSRLSSVSEAVIADVGRSSRMAVEAIGSMSMRPSLSRNSRKGGSWAVLGMASTASAAAAAAIAVAKTAAPLLWKALDVRRKLAASRLTALVGGACTGKSSVLAALAAAGGVVAKASGFRRAGPEFVVAFPAAVPPELLLGSGGEGEGVLPALLRDLSATAGERGPDAWDDAGIAQGGGAMRMPRAVVVLDAEVHMDWADHIVQLLQTGAFGAGGRARQLPRGAAFAFETRSLAGASPSFCSRCAITSFEDTLGPAEFVESFCRRVPHYGEAAREHAAWISLWIRKVVYGPRGAHDAAVAAAGRRPGSAGEAPAPPAAPAEGPDLLDVLRLAYTASDASGYYSDELGTSALVRTLRLAASVLAAHGRGLFGGSRAAVAAAAVATASADPVSKGDRGQAELLLLYALAWGLGGGLAAAGRRILGAYLLESAAGAGGLVICRGALEVLQQDPENLWRFRIVRTEFGDFSCALHHEERLQPGSFDGAGASLVPIPEAQAVLGFGRLMAIVRGNFVVCGRRFDGKSTLAEAHARGTIDLGVQPHVFRCWFRASGRDLSRLLLERAHRQGRRELGPRSGGQCCLVVDDVHLAEVSAAEALRQLTEQSACYEPRAGARTRLRNFSLVATAPPSFLRTGRWQRHLHSARIAEPALESMEQVLACHLSAWSADRVAAGAPGVPFEEAARSVCEAVAAACTELGSAPCRPFVLGALAVVARTGAAVRRLAAGAEGGASEEGAQRLIAHEAWRELGDGLRGMEDIAELAEAFREAGLPEFVKPTPVFFDLLEDDAMHGYCELEGGQAKKVVAKILGDELSQVSSAGALGVPIVVFDDFLAAAARVARALRLASPLPAADGAEAQGGPGAHGALVAGPGGVGKRACAVLGARLAGASLLRPRVCLSFEEELEDLRSALRSPPPLPPPPPAPRRRRGSVAESERAGSKELVAGDTHGGDPRPAAEPFHAVGPIVLGGARGGEDELCALLGAAMRRRGAADLDASQGATDTGDAAAAPRRGLPAMVVCWSCSGQGLHGLRRGLRWFPGLTAGLRAIWIDRWSPEALAEVARGALMPECTSLRPSEREQFANLAKAAADVHLQVIGRHGPNSGAAYAAMVSMMKDVLHEARSALEHERIELECACRQVTLTRNTGRLLSEQHAATLRAASDAQKQHEDAERRLVEVTSGKAQADAAVAGLEARLQAAGEAIASSEARMTQTWEPLLKNFEDTARRLAGVEAEEAAAECAAVDPEPGPEALAVLGTLAAVASGCDQDWDSARPFFATEDPTQPLRALEQLQFQSLQPLQIELLEALDRHLEAKEEEQRKLEEERRKFGEMAARVDTAEAAADFAEKSLPPPPEEEGSEDADGEATPATQAAPGEATVEEPVPEVVVTAAEESGGAGTVAEDAGEAPEDAGGGVEEEASAASTADGCPWLRSTPGGALAALCAPWARALLACAKRWPRFQEQKRAQEQRQADHDMLDQRLKQALAAAAQFSKGLEDAAVAEEKAREQAQRTQRAVAQVGPELQGKQRLLDALGGEQLLVWRARLEELGGGGSGRALAAVPARALLAAALVHYAGGAPGATRQLWLNAWREVCRAHRLPVPADVRPAGVQQAEADRSSQGSRSSRASRASRASLKVRRSVGGPRGSGAKRRESATAAPVVGGWPPLATTGPPRDLLDLVDDVNLGVAASPLSTLGDGERSLVDGSAAADVRSWLPESAAICLRSRLVPLLVDPLDIARPWLLRHLGSASERGVLCLKGWHDQQELVERARDAFRRRVPVVVDVLETVPLPPALRVLLDAEAVAPHLLFLVCRGAPAGPECPSALDPGGRVVVVQFGVPQERWEAWLFCEVSAWQRRGAESEESPDMSPDVAAALAGGPLEAHRRAEAARSAAARLRQQIIACLAGPENVSAAKQREASTGRRPSCYAIDVDFVPADGEGSAPAYELFDLLRLCEAADAADAQAEELAGAASVSEEIADPLKPVATAFVALYEVMLDAELWSPVYKGSGCRLLRWMRGFLRARAPRFELEPAAEAELADANAMLAECVRAWLPGVLPRHRLALVVALALRLGQRRGVLSVSQFAAVFALDAAGKNDESSEVEEGDEEEDSDVDSECTDGGKAPPQVSASAWRRVRNVFDWQPEIVSELARSIQAKPSSWLWASGGAKPDAAADEEQSPTTPHSPTTPRDCSLAVRRHATGVPDLKALDPCRLGKLTAADEALIVCSLAPHLAAAALRRLVYVVLGDAVGEALDADAPAPQGLAATIGPRGAEDGPPRLVLLLQEERIGDDNEDAPEPYVARLAASRGVQLSVARLGRGGAAEAAAAVERARDGDGWALILADGECSRQGRADAASEADLWRAIAQVIDVGEDDWDAPTGDFLVAVAVRSRYAAGQDAIGAALAPRAPALVSVAPPLGLRARLRDLAARACDQDADAAPEAEDLRQLGGLLAFHILASSRASMRHGWTAPSALAAADFRHAAACRAGFLAACGGGGAGEDFGALAVAMGYLGSIDSPCDRQVIDALARHVLGSDPTAWRPCADAAGRALSAGAGARPPSAGASGPRPPSAGASGAFAGGAAGARPPSAGGSEAPTAAEAAFEALLATFEADPKEGEVGGLPLFVASWGRETVRDIAVTDLLGGPDGGQAMVSSAWPCSELCGLLWTFQHTAVADEGRGQPTYSACWGPASDRDAVALERAEELQAELLAATLPGDDVPEQAPQGEAPLARQMSGASAKSGASSARSGPPPPPPPLPALEDGPLVPTLWREVLRMRRWRAGVLLSLARLLDALRGVAAFGDDDDAAGAADALWKGGVPESWNRLSCGFLECGGQPVADFAAEAVCRAAFLRSWAEEAGLGAYWLGALMCPVDFFAAISRANSGDGGCCDEVVIAVEAAGEESAPAPASAADMALVTAPSRDSEGTFAYGLALEGAVWGEGEPGLGATPSLELACARWLPLLRLTPLGEAERAKRLEDARCYRCPLLRRMGSPRPQALLDLPTSEDEAFWALRSVALLLRAA